MEKQITVSPDSSLFPMAQKVLHDLFKDYSAEPVSKTIQTKQNNKTLSYKFLVEWQDENQSTFEIFKVIPE